jgi:hypothetical protein
MDVEAVKVPGKIKIRPEILQGLRRVWNGFLTSRVSRKADENR